jgi:hypothetical protein
MDEVRRRNFERSHPGVAVPRLDRLSASDAAALRERILASTGLSKGTSDLELTRRIAQESTPIAGADPRSPGFNLQGLVSALSIGVTSPAYVNWNRYDVIDRVSFVDLSRFFSDIWYPDSDDIEIFDESCAWILVVPHSGDVRLAILRP